MHRAKLATGWLLAVPSGLLLALLCLLFVSRTTDDRRRDTAASPPPSRGPAESGKCCLYDPHTEHAWNRLYRHLYLRVTPDGREYGCDELDPLLWHKTTYLLSGPSYQRAISALNEFLDTHAEHLISDPLKRAILQRDLWAVFDWAAREPDSPSPERRNLQVKLAQVIRRLALPAEQIRALPRPYEDALTAKTFAANYDASRPEAAFLPPDLFEPGGPWVPLSVEGGGPVAPGHVADSSGRSVFRVFIRLPEGREATLAYLKSVSEFPRPWVRDRRNPADVRPNPELPQFPAGTQLALVRQMIVLDEQANPTPTSIIESVQVRVHRAIPTEVPDAFDSSRNKARAALDVYEFRLSRAKLFAGDAGGLRAVAREEKEFPLFQAQGIDPFELQETGPESIEQHRSPTLESCSNCHFRPGIHSVLSRVPDIFALRLRDVRRNITPSQDSAYEADSTRGWKQGQASWKLLREMWP